MPARTASRNPLHPHDPAGRLTQRTHATNGVTDYGFDDRGLLTKVNQPGITIEYSYDALGVRKSKTVNGDTTQYLTANVFGFPRVLMELSPSMDIKATYAYAGHLPLKEEPVAADRSKDLYLLHSGIVGSVTHALDNTGSIKHEYDYDAFGIRTDVSAGGSSHKHYGYTGEEYDVDTGLLYLRARYYDPRLGRFVSADPYWGRLEEPVTQNRYIYVHNNPLVFVDPSGLASDSVDLSYSGSIFTLYGHIQTSKVTFTDGNKATLVEFGVGKTTAVAPTASVMFGNTHTTANSPTDLAGHGYTSTLDGALGIAGSAGPVFGNGYAGYTTNFGVSTSPGVSLTGVKTYTVVIPSAVPPTWVPASERHRSMDHGVSNKSCLQ